MRRGINSGIVRVIKACGETAGTGFLVNEKQVVTCAHVVESARDGSSDLVRIQFLRGEIECKAVIESTFYRSPTDEDVAFLTIQESLPADVKPLTLESSQDTSDLEFESFGFPRPKSKNGLWGVGVIRNKLKDEGGHEVIQLTSTTITNGFSGAPVLNKYSQCVVGMITSITAPDIYQRLQDTAFATPAETLLSICPELYFNKPSVGITEQPQAETHPLFDFPPVPPHFVARSEEILKAKRILLRKKNNAVALCGMAGVGKTTLASKLVSNIKGQFPGGALWADFPAHGGDPLPIMYSWAQLCNSEEVGSIVSPQIRAQAIARMLNAYTQANGKVIAVFDDVRQTESDAWLEGAMLLKSAIPEGTPLLLTTRQTEISTALGLETLTLEVLPPEKAKSLLVRRGINDEKTAEALAHSVGYLPLALEILIGVIQDEGIEWVKDNLKGRHTRLDVLRSGKLRNKDRNVRASFELSYSSLDEDEKNMFQLLGGFAPGHIKTNWVRNLLNQPTLEGMFMSGKWEQLLRDLRHRSLISKTSGGFRLHPLIHDFSYLLLLENHRLEKIRTAHESYFLQEARAKKDDFDEISAMFENLASAASYAYEGLRWSDLRDFVLNLATSRRYLYVRGLWSEALKLLSLGIKGAVASDDAKTHALLLCEVGIIQRESANHRAALIAFDQAISLCEKEGDEHTLAAAYMGKGFVFLYSGKYQDAKRVLRQAVDLGQSAKNDVALGEALRALGRVEFSMGELSLARSYLERSLRIHRKSGYRQGIAYVFTALGKVTSFEGDNDTALKHFFEGLDLAKQLGELQSQGYILRGIGDVYKSKGDLEQALIFYGDSERAYKNTRDLAGLASLNCNKGEIYVAQGRMDMARLCFKECAELAAKAQVPRWQTRSLFGQALCEHFDGNTDLACQLAFKALKRFETMRHRDIALVRGWLSERCSSKQNI